MWILSISVTLLLGAILYVWYYFRPPKDLASMPTISYVSVLWYILIGAPIDIRHKKLFHGPNSSLKKLFFQGKWKVTITDIDLMKTVLNNTELYPKVLLEDEWRGTLYQEFFGSNVVFSDGDTWKRQRKIINPAFHRSWNTESFGEIGLVLLEELDKIDKNPVEIHSWMQRVTLDVLGKAIFNYDFRSLQNENNHHVQLYNSLLSGVFQPLFMLFPFLSKLPLPSVRDLRRKIEEFDRFLMGIVKERKLAMENEAKDTESKDLLSLMIASSLKQEEESGEFLTEKELRDNVVVFFLAGHDTTAHSLSAVLYFFSLHPEIQTQCYNEVMRVLGDPTEIRYPTFHEQSRLKFLTCVIKESLRLYPSVSFFPDRKAAKDTVLGQQRLPEGTPVNMNIFGAMRSPAFWDDPEKFCPERFLVKDTEDENNVGCPLSANKNFLAFGYGSRACIGQNFSYLEQRVVLSMVLQKYQISLPKASPHAEGLILRPMNLLAPKDLRLVLSPRA